jgi:hypothetical protein
VAGVWLTWRSFFMALVHGLAARGARRGMGGSWQQRASRRILLFYP